MVEAQERQLYLRVPAVAANLARLPTETRVDIICKAPRDAQQAVLSGRFKMNYGGLDQVSGTVEFMQISQIFEPMLWTPGQNMAVDIAVRLLCPLKQINDLINAGLQCCVWSLLEPGGSCFEPFAQIGVPEYAAAPVAGVRPWIGQFAATMHSAIQKHRIHVPVGTHFLELVGQGSFSDEITPSLPKAIRDLYLVAGEGSPANIHAQLYDWRNRGKN